VPDPAGLAAVDLTNPQTWNRYAYVGNNPLGNVDPLGLFVVECRVISGQFICADGGEDTPGLGFDFPVPWPSSPPPPSPPPTQPPAQQPINFPNETNGLPNGFPTNPWGIAGAIIPNGNCADMGPCNPIGTEFLAAGLPSVSIFSLSPGFVNYIELFFQMGKSGSCQESIRATRFFYDVCGNNNMVFVGPAWTCSGSRDCCLDKGVAFIGSCTKRGLRSAFFDGLQAMEAACCRNP
jgi:hypothetical protein